MSQHVFLLQLKNGSLAASSSYIKCEYKFKCVVYMYIFVGNDIEVTFNF